MLVGGRVLKDGRRLGEVRLTVINTAVADAVYERFLVVTETVRWVVAGGREFSRKKSALPRFGLSMVLRGGAPRWQQRCHVQAELSGIPMVAAGA